MFFIAICGLSASGKSYICELIKAYLYNKYKLKSKIISIDMFYKEYSEYSEIHKKKHMPQIRPSVSEAIYVLTAR